MKVQYVIRSQISSHRQHLSLATLVALVVANMVGAGVFTSSGFSMATLGNPARVMLAWSICGVWAICGAIAYGALVSRLPYSGGEYLFLSRVVHPSIGFLAGWISVIAGFTAPIAAAALGAATYAMPANDAGPSPALVAAGLILVATVCHQIGISLGAGIQNMIVAAKLLLLSVFIGWAYLGSPVGAWQGGPLAGSDDSWLPSDLHQWTVLVGSMSWIALSYTGFNAAVYVAGESQDAKRHVPLAMVVATVAVTVFYLLLNGIFVYAPDSTEIANEERVATIAASAIGGTQLSGLIQVTIVLSMSSSVFAMLLTGPRVYQRMADDGVMPKFLRTDGGSVRFAIMIQAALSIVALGIADLLQLMKYLGLTLSACGALATMSLWWIGKKLPEAAPLKIWENLAVFVYLTITGLILLASQTTHPLEFRAMLVTFAVGACVYLLWNVPWNRNSPLEQPSQSAGSTHDS